MDSEKYAKYNAKYIKLDAILAMLLEKLNLEIDEKAIYLVAKYFDTKIEEAAAELAKKFK